MTTGQLTPIISKCFERLVLGHIKPNLPPTWDQHQYAYRTNRSTEDTVNTVLRTALTNLEQGGTYTVLHLIIIPSRLVCQLEHLGHGNHLHLWIQDFFTNRPQPVTLGHYDSLSLTLSTGAPQGCVLSPVLYSLCTHDCIPTHPQNHNHKICR